MSYRIEYHEEHDGEEIGSHVHVFLSGSEIERELSLGLIESAIGKDLGLISYGVFDDGTHYKIRREEWPWRTIHESISRITEQAKVFGVRGMRDGDLITLERDILSPFSRDAHLELGLRQREAGHMVNQWYPPSY